MSNYIVTRHQAAVRFISENMNQEFKIVEHADACFMANLQQGDTVAGVLPVELAAEVVERTKNPFYNISLNVPRELLGTEIDYGTMISKCNPQVVKYDVYSPDDNLSYSMLKRSNKIIFVCRHSGAAEFINNLLANNNNNNIEIHEYFDNNMIDKLSKADTVVGILPMNLVSQLNANNINYFNLNLAVPQQLRGQSLTWVQMVQCGASLQQYIITQV